MSLARSPRFFRILPAILLAVVVTACQSTHIEPQYIGKSKKDASTIVVAPVEMKDESWKEFGETLRQAMVTRLGETAVFKEVTTAAPEPLPFSAVRLTTEIVAAERKVVEMPVYGMQDAKGLMSTVFRVRDANGDLLLQFRGQSKAASKIDTVEGKLVDLDAMAQELGAEAANAVMRWAVGRYIEAPAS